jgi:hypothetical protein
LGWLDGSRPTRGICQHCVDEELDVQQFNTAREMGRLLEAERSADGESLARMAEFYEEWWNGKETPEFISAFIARHLTKAAWGQIIAAGIVSVPFASSTPDPIAIDAARVALLMMRGALAKNGDTKAKAYLISPPGSALTPADAARWLAAVPKPVVCRAFIHDGYMAVRCAPMDDPARRAAHEAFADHRKRAPRREARHAKNPRADLIYCVGADEFLLVSQEAIDKAFEDYEVSPIGVNSDVPAFYLSTHPEAARDAYAKGAVGMMKCAFAPDAWAREESGRTVMIRNEAWRVEIVLEHAPGLARPCDQCGQAGAGWHETDVRSPVWIERALCERCAISVVEPMARHYAEALETLLEAPPNRPLSELEALHRVLQSLHGRERDQRAEDLKSAADLLERAWRVLPMPGFVKDALTRYRNVA